MAANSTLYLSVLRKLYSVL